MTPARRLAKAIVASLVAGLFLGCGGALGAETPEAEEIQMGISADVIPVTSDFKGTRLVVFGVIENPDRIAQVYGRYGIAVVVKGENEDIVVRRKQRVFGIWMNRQARVYRGVPSFYLLAASRSLEAPGSAGELKANRIGVNNLELNLFSEGGATFIGPAPEFAASLRAIRIKSGAFSEHADAVDFLGSSLFRATLPIPSNIPIGSHNVTAYLFKDGKLLASRSGAFDVRKEGFEEFIHGLAKNHALLHGVIAVIIALSTGWLASVVFGAKRK